MLPARHRLRRSADFRRTVGRGRRVRGDHLVVHCLALGTGDQPRIGIVVSRSVGGAVVRHRVSRRLRHVIANVVVEVPRGAMVVLRALPTAATASSAELARDLDGILGRALATAETRRAPVEAGAARSVGVAFVASQAPGDSG